MSLLVTGSIGIDTVKTPFGVSENCLGGSAVYFSMAASFLSPVRFMGVVGDDCPFDLNDTFAGRAVDLTGLEVRAGSKTFRWCGSYEGAMNDVNTDAVELNVLAEAPLVVLESFKGSEVVFLANTHPGLQLQLLEQIHKPRLVVADTMNLWIENEPEALKRLLGRIDGLVLNEGEAKMLSGERNLVAAGEHILTLGPRVVVIKKGEYGAFMLSREGARFAIPAYPVIQVKDPTGAGDSFAGGMMGYLARNNVTDDASIRRAMVFGTVMSSFVVEDFSLEPFFRIEDGDIWDRYHEYVRFITV